MKFTIDRFEDKYAVCEFENGTNKDILRSSLPIDAVEGDIIQILDVDTYSIAVDETNTRKKSISKLMNDLFVD